MAEPTPLVMTTLPVGYMAWVSLDDRVTEPVYGTVLLSASLAVIISVLAMA